MPTNTRQLAKTIERLQRFYGPPEPPRTVDPLQMVLLENVAYLVDDRQREEAFSALQQQVGLSPKRILAAAPEKLLGVTQLGGMHPERRVQKLRLIARIVIDDFGGDLLGALAEQTPERAKKLLMKFPGIGEPGAEKILLFGGCHPFVALESNGLRVLVRLGFGTELKSYAATYRSVQDAVASQTPANCAWLVRAHQLLRRHGQELCKRSRPLCSACPISDGCRFYLRGSAFARLT